jgi:hypothetical protein
VLGSGCTPTREKHGRNSTRARRGHRSLDTRARQRHCARPHRRVMLSRRSLPDPTPRPSRASARRCEVAARLTPTAARRNVRDIPGRSYQHPSRRHLAGLGSPTPSSARGPETPHQRKELPSLRAFASLVRSRIVLDRPSAARLSKPVSWFHSLVFSESRRLRRGCRHLLGAVGVSNTLSAIYPCQAPGRLPYPCSRERGGRALSARLAAPTSSGTWSPPHPPGPLPSGRRLRRAKPRARAPIACDAAVRVCTGTEDRAIAGLTVRATRWARPGCPGVRSPSTYLWSR